MNKVLFGVIGILFLAIIGIGGYTMLSTDTGTAPVETDSTIPAGAQDGTGQVADTPAPEKTFTLADIEAHSTESDCYTAVNGIVYDLTSFVKSHPGGVRNITKICGKDGTEEFSTQHGGQGRPETMLATLEIGVLQ